MSYPTLTIKNERYVVVPKREFDRLARSAGKSRLPRADLRGRRPALATLDALIADDIASAREKAGLTQAELARRSGVRIETISRVETGKHSPSLATIRKLGKVIDLG